MRYVFTMAWLINVYTGAARGARLYLIVVIVRQLLESIRPMTRCSRTVQDYWFWSFKIQVLS